MSNFNQLYLIRATIVIDAELCIVRSMQYIAQLFSTRHCVPVYRIFARIHHKLSCDLEALNRYESSCNGR